MASNRLSVKHPQMPSGTEVAAFRTHEEASAAVERLAENQFPITTVTIVGSDLHMTEKVLTKLTPAKVALTGATQGLTWGLFMAIFSILFYPQAAAIVPLIAIVVGILLGMLLSTTSWALSKSRGSFAAQSGLVATRYAILVTEMPDRAFTILSGMPGNLSSQPRRPVRRDHVTALGSPDFSAPPVPEPTAGEERVVAAPRWDNVSHAPNATESAPVQQGQTNEGAETKPTEYGSRPDEAPRFGVRVSDVERERMKTDSPGDAR